MGFFEKLGLTEEVPENQKSAPKPSPSLPGLQRPLTPMPGTMSLSAPVFSPHSEVSADPAVVAKLEGLVQKNTPPAYASFMGQYQKLQKYIPDQAALFQAALEASGGTPEQLSSALNQVINVVDSAKQDFTRALDTQKQSLAQMDAVIQTKEAQIQTLQQEILAARQSRDTSAQTLDAKEQGFNAAHAQVLGQLTSQKTHIDSHIKG